MRVAHIEVRAPCRLRVMWKWQSHWRSQQLLRKRLLPKQRLLAVPQQTQRYYLYSSRLLKEPLPCYED